jgi:hypothetical protein
MISAVRFVIALGLLAGCQAAAPPATTASTQTATDGDWQGVYQGPYHTFLRIQARGTHAQGTWVAAGNRTGEFSGELDGNVLRYTWTERRSPEESWSGRGYFVYTLPADGGSPEISGEWGLGARDFGNQAFAVKRTDLAANASGASLVDRARGGDDMDSAPGEDGGDICVTCDDEFTSDD